MIRHIVLVKFRADLPDREIAAIFADLEALQTVVPGMVDFHAGGNVSPEHLGRGYGHAFVADFADAQARDAYLDHPAHKAAGSRLVAGAQGGRDGILVFDLAV